MEGEQIRNDSSNIISGFSCSHHKSQQMKGKKKKKPNKKKAGGGFISQKTKSNASNSVWYTSSACSV